MTRIIKNASQKAGLPPGSLIHIGTEKTEEITIEIIDYGEKQYERRLAGELSDCFAYQGKESLTWINVDGVHQEEVIERVGKQFGLHSLLLEDVLNTEQRPKFEDYGDHLFLVLKMISYSKEEEKIKVEQISMVFNNDFLISFQEQLGDVFDNIREAISKEKTKIRRKGTDFLAYSLLDAIVDNYFLVLENIDDKIQEIEEELITRPRAGVLQKIHALKREMIFLRKSAWPLREVISGLERTDSPIIEDSTRIYLRDLYDHTIQVVEAIETFQDILSGMLDIYLSSTGNKMNEVMKVLTVISTIFIPLTFIAGIYGMNFKYMPELDWRWGYFITLLIMAGTASVMVLYFHRKKWL